MGSAWFADSHQLQHLGSEALFSSFASLMAGFAAECPLSWPWKIGEAGEKQVKCSFLGTAPCVMNASHKYLNPFA